MTISSRGDFDGSRGHDVVTRSSRRRQAGAQGRGAKRGNRVKEEEEEEDNEDDNKKQEKRRRRERRPIIKRRPKRPANFAAIMSGARTHSFTPITSATTAAFMRSGACKKAQV